MKKWSKISDLQWLNMQFVCVLNIVNLDNKKEFKNKWYVNITKIMRGFHWEKVTLSKNDKIFLKFGRFVSLSCQHLRIRVERARSVFSGINGLNFCSSSMYLIVFSSRPSKGIQPLSISHKSTP